MVETDYKQALDAATKELAEVMEQLEEIEEVREKTLRRIYVLRDGIYGLSAMLGEDPLEVSPELFLKYLEPDTGFTDAIRKVLELNKSRYMNPVSVRDKLKDMGYDLSKYTNPLASIHTILKRLVESGEVEPDEGVGGRTVYRWKNVGLGSFRQFSDAARGAGALFEAAERAREQANSKATSGEPPILRRPVRTAPTGNTPDPKPVVEAPDIGRLVRPKRGQSLYELGNKLIEEKKKK
jgi:hypothetical protein